MQPYFIAGFFFPQQIAQLVWLYRMWRLDENKPDERRELEDYVPYYAIGNLSIACESFCSFHLPCHTPMSRRLIKTMS
jgi:hypothetical protein